MRREYKKVTLRLDPDLHERVSAMLAEASANRHRKIPTNYIAQELLRWCCDEYERDKADKKQPTFNAFVKDHL